MSTQNITDYVASIQDMAEAVRNASVAPLDQIRLLCELAEFGRGSVDQGNDPVGVLCFRHAGPSNIWATTQRSTVGTYVDAQGIVRTAQPRIVRPTYSKGVVSGYLDEPERTNLQMSSDAMTIGSGIYSKGGNAIDLGLVTAPDGTNTARRLESGPSGPGNVYISRATRLTVSSSTTYTISAYVRKAAGTLSGGSGLTVDEHSSGGSLQLRNGSVNMANAGSDWLRYSRTFTTRSDTASMQIYWADNWTVGAQLDVWGFQVEQGSTATSFISTPMYGTATRSADNISLLTPPSLGTIAKAEVESRLAVEALCRRAALVSMARAIGDYIPSSANEAKAVLARVMPLYDAEILNAGDIGDYQTYNDLRSLRAMVADDIKNRAIRLPEIVRVTRSNSQPSLVLAHALYEDATRSDELVQRVDPPHPLFFPAVFDTLSSY